MGQKVYTISPLSHKKIKNYGEKERYYSKDRHEAIISRELWDKVHDILKKRNGRPMLNGKKHQERYSMRYAFSSKIVCGFCGANYSRRSSGKNKNGKQNIYWACMGRIDKNECEESIYIKEEILENLFIQIYNSIIDNKHKTKDKLLGAIKSVVEENHAKTKLDKLELQENNIRTKISNLIDLKLENVIDKEAYIEKEKELQNQLNNILEQKEEYKNLENENHKIAKQLKDIEQVLDTPLKLKEFEREVFDNIIERIIIGEIEEDGTHNNKIIRFILKTGAEFKKNLTENTVKFNGNNNVSLEQRKTPRHFVINNKIISRSFFKKKSVITKTENILKVQIV